MISLSPGETVTVTITWDTTETPYDSYYISAIANPVLGENNIRNNFIGAVSFVGGICRPWQPKHVDLSLLLMGIAYATLVVSVLTVLGVG